VAPPIAYVEREKVVALVVRQVVPPVGPTQREIEFRGNQLLGSSREEKAFRTVQRKLYFRGSQ